MNLYQPMLRAVQAEILLPIHLAPRHLTLADNCRIYAFSDMHGRLDMFEESLRLIRQNISRDPPKQGQQVYVLTLGDLIDKGPRSCAVIDGLLNVRDIPVFSLIGNHEKNLIDFVNGPSKGQEDEWVKIAHKWFLNSAGKATMQSYGLDVSPLMPVKKKARLAGQEICGETLMSGLLNERQKLIDVLKERNHFSYFSNLYATAKRGDFVFCHAQLLHDKKIEDHKLDEFINGFDIVEYDGAFVDGNVVVYGHASNNDPPRCKPFSIGIDPSVMKRNETFVMRLDGNGDVLFLESGKAAPQPRRYLPSPNPQTQTAMAEQDAGLRLINVLSSRAGATYVS